MKFKTTNNGMSRLGNGLLALAVCGCFGFLASCSSDDSISDGGGANINTASIANVKTSDNSRVTLFKSLASGRAASRTAATNLTMPDQPTIPSDAAEITTVNDLNTAMYTDHKTVYHITKNAQIDDIGFHFNVDKAVVYVEGKFNVNIAGTNNTIYVFPGGEITNGKCFIAGDYGDTRYVYNYGGIVTQPEGYTVNCTTYMTTDDFTSNGKWDSKSTLYVKGNLTEQGNYSHSGNIQVVGNVVSDGFNLDSGGNMYVDGQFTADYCSMNSSTIKVGCSMIVKNKLDVNGGGVNLILLDGGYVEADEVNFAATSNITLSDGGMIKGLSKINMNNAGGANDNGVTIEGDGANAAIVTKTFLTNSLDMTQTFKFPGSGSHLALCFDEIVGNGQAVAQGKPNILPSVKCKTDDGFTDIVIKKTGCNPDGLNDDGNDNKDDDNKQTVDPDPTDPTTPDTPDTPDEPKKPTLDEIAQIDPEHTHPISATCVDFNPTTSKAYLCWHARGTGEAGCLEIIDHSNLESPKLVSYLQAFDKNLYDGNYSSNDKQSYIDYNHCIYDNGKLYAVGNMPKGGHLSYVKLTSDGLFDATSQSNETTDLNNAGILKYILLDAGERKSCDGNCIIRQGDDFLVASTSGFETLDANTLEEKNFVATPGKGKHIATDGNKVLTLNYDQFVSDETQALKAIVKVYDANDHKFANPTTVADGVDMIQPNNGKNTIKISDNEAYVCLAKNGLVRYDLNGNKTGEFKLDRITLADGTDVIGAACNGVDIHGDYVYVAYGSFGVYVLNKSDLSIVDSHRNTGGKSANYVKVIDRGGVPYIYVAYGESGFAIYRLVEK